MGNHLLLLLARLQKKTTKRRKASATIKFHGPQHGERERERSGKSTGNKRGRKKKKEEATWSFPGLFFKVFLVRVQQGNYSSFWRGKKRGSVQRFFSSSSTSFPFLKNIFFFTYFCFCWLSDSTER